MNPYRNLFLLFACESCTRTASVILLTVMALLGRQLAPSPDLATLPLALVPVATLLTTFPAARLMRRRGRRLGFSLGAVIGALGASLALAGVLHAAFWVLCLGALGVGAAGGFATYYRFAAAEAVDIALKSRAISLVMGGGIAAALLGSRLAVWSRDWLGDNPFAGPFACILLVHLLSLGFMALVRLPLPSAEEQAREGRPLWQIARQPACMLALAGAVLSWGIMSLLMNATPLCMGRHHHAFADTAQVIQWHVLGMYVPAFFTGHLIGRFGETRMMLAGVMLLLGAAGVGLSGLELEHFLVGLTLLGVGWNFLFVSATALLTTTYEPWERTRVQALNDFAVFGALVLSTLASGPLEEQVGWEALNRGTIPVLLGALVVVFWFGWRQRLRPAESRSARSSG
ncbi:MAG: MFS transporter [Candidatus Latescibacteria bacterium]|nr:MFS transporter [Candidatus Latescibacterota bacterium]